MAEFSGCVCEETDRTGEKAQERETRDEAQVAAARALRLRRKGHGVILRATEQKTDSSCEGVDFVTRVLELSPRGLLVPAKKGSSRISFEWFHSGPEDEAGHRQDNFLTIQLAEPERFIRREMGSSVGQPLAIVAGVGRVSHDEM